MLLKNCHWHVSALKQEQDTYLKCLVGQAHHGWRDALCQSLSVLPKPHWDTGMLHGFVFLGLVLYYIQNYTVVFQRPILKWHFESSQGLTKSSHIGTGFLFLLRSGVGSDRDSVP